MESFKCLFCLNQNSNLRNDTKLSVIVIREASIIKNDAYANMINHNTVSQFQFIKIQPIHPQNQPILFFTNSLPLAKKLKKLNNKRSVRHDQI